MVRSTATKRQLGGIVSKGHQSDGTLGAIDLRTDVVSPPTEEMWEAMRRAKLGFALNREDRSVNELEALGADLMGKEAGLFLPTTSMSNLLSLMTLGERGTQVVIEANTHIFWYEQWGVAYICGLFTRLIPGDNGLLDPAEVEQAITLPQTTNLPRTSVVCLENSHNRGGGVAVTPEQTAAVADIAHRYGAAVHLDGARLFNSAVALGIPVKRLTAAVDTVGISLNKGLSAPYGSLLCGSSETIKLARINLVRIGGASIHKAGILAAAGIVALTKMVDRLAEDNRRAAELALLLSKVPGFRVDLATVQTNLVFVDIDPHVVAVPNLVARLAELGVLVGARPPHRIRFCTHIGIGDADLPRVAEAASLVMNEARASIPTTGE